MVASKKLLYKVMIVLFLILSCFLNFTIYANAKGKALYVKISGYAYSPQEINISPGDTVIWTNEDEETHSVTTFKPPSGKDLKKLEQGDKKHDGKINSGLFEKVGKFKYTFKKAGSYYYFCSSHIFMVGKVSVKP